MQGTCCYPKAARIRRRAEFLELQRNGRRVQTSNFVVIFRDSPGPARLGVTVSAKIGNAVQRNFVKRRIRETFRTVSEEIRRPARFVVIAKSGATQLSQSAAANEIRALFCREG